MTLESTASKAASVLASRALRNAEWMAENAYIAPGFHRLLTAGGLTLGLWGGRKVMDVVTARRSSTGEEVPAAQTSELLRPLHGMMRYNPYSDEASDRWKYVADHLAPVALGAVGAYWGGKLFFNRRMPSGEPFSAASMNVKKAWGEKKYSTEAADTMLGLSRSDALRKWAAATFVEGSSSGMHFLGALWPFNNGMIAESFRQGAGRNVYFPFAGPINRWFGNHGATSRNLYAAVRDTSKWMETNVTKFNDADEWAHPKILLSRARDGLQKFPNRSVEDEEKLAREFRKLIDEAYAHKARFIASNPNASADQISAAVYHYVSGAHHAELGLTPRGLLGASYDRLLHDLGFDLSKAQFARDPLAFFSRLFGSRADEHATLKTYAEYLNDKFHYGISDTAAWAEAQLKMDPWKVTAAYTSGLGAIGVGLAGAGVAATRLNKESSNTHKPHIHTSEIDPKDVSDVAAGIPVTPKNKRSDNLVDWINGKPLDVAHWISRVLITPPSMHRFMNAAYLSVVLYGGMKFSNVLTGRKLTKIMSGALTPEGVSESLVPLKEVWAPFRPLHGILAYTPGSATIQDRWRQATHYVLPVVVGMFGTYGGSYMYFRDREKSLEKPRTLEDFADRISFEQSKVYAGATAITSIFNTGSGIHLLPVFNYSSNLHNRYLMGAGQQVAMPGIGKWWSGNAGMTPWGVKLSLTHMTQYLTHNPQPRPRELPSLVHSVIGKLYPKLGEKELLDKKQIIIDRIYDVRDSYLVDGLVPAAKQPALNEAMQKLLHGVGFEMLLRDAGLDPAKANLASNGASGAIANFFGRRKDVQKLTNEYHQQFAERLAKEKDPLPSVYLRNLLDKGPANDSSFVARVKAEPRSNEPMVA